jgi:hypothetical protein
MASASLRTRAQTGSTLSSAFVSFVCVDMTGSAISIRLAQINFQNASARAKSVE